MNDLHNLKLDYVRIYNRNFEGTFERKKIIKRKRFAKKTILNFLQNKTKLFEHIH